jgi:hypothetical protein
MVEMSLLVVSAIPVHGQHQTQDMLVLFVQWDIYKTSVFLPSCLPLAQEFLGLFVLTINTDFTCLITSLPAPTARLSMAVTMNWASVSHRLSYLTSIWVSPLDMCRRSFE